MAQLILMRHGQSMWNASERFTGWVDVPLTPRGIEQAIEAGKAFAKIDINEVHVSALSRAKMTALIALAQRTDGRTPIIMHNDNPMEKMRTWSKPDPWPEEAIPVYVTTSLNERMYGDLQCQYKEDVKAEHGDDLFLTWRRSLNTPPPNGESLSMCAQRTIPYLESNIIPSLKQGKNVLVAAHGNSLRSIIMSLEKLDTTEVIDLEVPTGTPILFDFDGTDFTRKH